VVIVDDVVTTGTSGLQAAVRAEEAGCQVIKIVAIVDRDGGGRELYAEHGYPFESLFVVSDFRVAVQ
jgi:orotate phosphoribosyltransferase